MSLAAWTAVAAVVVGLAFSSAAPARVARASLPKGFVGMVVDQPVWPDPFVDLPHQLDVMLASGVQSLRVVFNWSQVQPYRGWSQVPQSQRGQFVTAGGVPTDFATLDTLVGLAAHRGMTVLPVIQDAPSWDGQNYKGGIVTLPRRPGPYAAFARALVLRYGPSGTFWRDNPGTPKLPIRMWQVWNEPNIPAFWPPQPYYTRYLALLRATRAAVKGADPGAKIVLAGLPNYSWIEVARIDRYPGASKLYDVVAVHPYTKDPQGVITILGYVRHQMNLTGDAGKPILADEISWPSSLGHTIHDVGYDFATTQNGQARNLAQLLPMLVRNRVRLGLAGFYYYDWAGEDRDNYLAFDFAGLFHFSGGAFQAKPAYNVFRSAALAMEGCRAIGPRAGICQG